MVVNPQSAIDERQRVDEQGFHAEPVAFNRRLLRKEHMHIGGKWCGHWLKLWIAAWTGRGLSAKIYDSDRIGEVQTVCLHVGIESYPIGRAHINPGVDHIDVGSGIDTRCLQRTIRLVVH